MIKDKVRLYQLAHELGIDSKELIGLLRAAGSDVKSHMATIDAATRQLAQDLVSGKKTVESVRESAPAARAPAPGPIPPPKMVRPHVIPATQVVETTAAPTEEPAAPPTEPVAPAAVASEAEPCAPFVAAAVAEPTIEEPSAAPAPAAAVAPAPPEAAGPTPAPPSAAPAPPVPPPRREMTPIPAPTSKRPGVIPLARGEGGSGRVQRPAREPVAGRPRPVVPPPPPPPAKGKGRAETPKKKEEPAAQQPVIRLSPDALRNGQFGPPERGGTGTLAPPQFETALLDEDAEAAKRRRGGAVAGREERQRRRGQRLAAKRQEFGAGEEEDDRSAVKPTIRSRLRRHEAAAKHLSGPLVLEQPVTVRSFSEKTGIRVSELQRKLMDLGSLATINEALSEEQIETLGLEFSLNLMLKRPRDAETLLEESLQAAPDEPEDVVARPPVVTFMGHVDHGKTSLMDRIRSSNVAAGEAGGITQHIGAYQVRTESGGVISFLDTPGHEAFTAMRARGANVTDIVVLVVAADDGVMPQTAEAISHAKAADVPIVVAMNKIDLPGADVARLQQQLSTHGIIPESWGGDVLMVPTSAVTGAGMTELLEAISIVAELKELRANPQRPASGMCIEASLSEGRGVQATLLVRNGTLRRGELVLCGSAVGRVRAMFDDHNRPVEAVGPSTPVVISGLDEVPEAGEPFWVLKDAGRAREIADERRSKARQAAQSVRKHVTLEGLFDTLQEQKLKELLLIVKADVRGSLEALRKEVLNLTHPEVRVRILHDGVGGISESDVLLADASDAIIIGFGVVADERARSLAEEKGVEVRRYEIIYQVTDDIRKALEGLLEPEAREVQTGRAVVQDTFHISRIGTVAGCRVIQGTIDRSSKLRVVRDGAVIGAYAIESLRRVRDDVREVREGLECGIKLAGFDDVKRGDLLEGFKIEKIKRTL